MSRAHAKNRPRRLRRVQNVGICLRAYGGEGKQLLRQTQHGLGPPHSIPQRTWVNDLSLRLAKFGVRVSSAPFA